MNLSEMVAEANRLSRLLDGGLEFLREQTQAAAQAEADYRKAKGKAWAEAPSSEERSKWTAAEREAWVNAKTADLRYARDLADGMRRAAMEGVRSRRQQVSLLQTMVNAHQEEASFARTGPERAA